MKMKPAKKTIGSFNVWHVLKPEWSHVVTAKTPTVARYLYFLKIQDAFSDIRYVDIRARKLPGLVTSDRLRRVAEYRGVELVAGSRVWFRGVGGCVVDGTDDCNFMVEWDDGRRSPIHVDELEVNRTATETEVGCD